MNNVINVNQQANIYLNELKNSIATWNYACNEATEYEGQLSETSRHWEGCRQDAANDVFNKHINLSAHCIHLTPSFNFRHYCKVEFDILPSIQVLCFPAPIHIFVLHLHKSCQTYSNYYHFDKSYTESLFLAHLLRSCQLLIHLLLFLLISFAF